MCVNISPKDMFLFLPTYRQYRHFPAYFLHFVYLVLIYSAYALMRLPLAQTPPYLSLSPASQIPQLPNPPRAPSPSTQASRFPVAQFLPSIIPSSSLPQSPTCPNFPMPLAPPTPSCPHSPQGVHRKWPVWASIISPSGTSMEHH